MSNQVGQSDGVQRSGEAAGHGRYRCPGLEVDPSRLSRRGSDGPQLPSITASYRGREEGDDLRQSCRGRCGSTGPGPCGVVWCRDGGKRLEVRRLGSRGRQAGRGPVYTRKIE